MSKIIIQNNTDKSDDEILLYVGHVIRGGRVSKSSNGDQYCYVTTWPSGIVIYASRNKKSDRFRVDDLS